MGTSDRAGCAERVLVVEQGGRGGVADYTGCLAVALAHDGADVTLATARDHLYPALTGVATRPVFRYVRGRSWPARIARRLGAGRALNGMAFLAAIPALVRLARRADVVHTQGWEDLRLGLIAVAALRATGVPIVQTEHNTFERGAALERTRALLARLTARTIVHARSDVEHAYARDRGHVAVIPHGEYGALARSGGDGDRDAARRRLGIPASATVALVFGQLRTDKGLGDLLEAARAVDDLHVLVAGEDLGALGAERERLASPALNGRLHVRPGHVAMTEAAQLFAAADVAVLPYPRASQSGVLLLAYGFGRAAVAYPVGGLAEAVSHGRTGWLTAAPTPGALAATLTEVVHAGHEEILRRGAEGRRVAAERYAWPAIAVRTRDVYAAVVPRRAACRSARTLFAAELRAGVVSDAEITTPAVLAALMAPPIPLAPVRAAALVRRRLGRLSFDDAVAPLHAARQAVCGERVDAPPRFLVRVDEFPHYLAADAPDRYGTDAFARFHAILSNAGVPYLLAVPSRVSEAPLDPHGTASRALSAEEIATLSALEGVELALHGRTHRTRHRSPRRRSELTGLTAEATSALLDTALGELHDAGLPRPRAFVPPFNRFSARQYDLLAARFAIICSGPETIATLGVQPTPQWRGGALHVPSYEPFYGRARALLPHVLGELERRRGLWIPITLHWGWEADAGWADLERLAAVLAPHAARWEELHAG